MTNHLHKHRRSRRWRLRFWIGGLLQRAAWYVLDPHDRWVIDYYNGEGHRCGQTIEGFFSMARAWAKERRGRVIGWHASAPIAADDFPDQNGADWWKKGK